MGLVLPELLTLQEQVEIWTFSGKLPHIQMLGTISKIKVLNALSNRTQLGGTVSPGTTSYRA